MFVSWRKNGITYHITVIVIERGAGALHCAWRSASACQHARSRTQVRRERLVASAQHRPVQTRRPAHWRRAAAGVAAAAKDLLATCLSKRNRVHGDTNKKASAHTRMGRRLEETPGTLGAAARAHAASMRRGLAVQAPALPTQRAPAVAGEAAAPSWSGPGQKRDRRGSTGQGSFWGAANRWCMSREMRDRAVPGGAARPNLSRVTSWGRHTPCPATACMYVWRPAGECGGVCAAASTPSQCAQGGALSAPVGGAPGGAAAARTPGTACWRSFVCARLKAGARLRLRVLCSEHGVLSKRPRARPWRTRAGKGVQTRTGSPTQQAQRRSSLRASGRYPGMSGHRCRGVAPSPPCSSGTLRKTGVAAPAGQQAHRRWRPLDSYGSPLKPRLAGALNALGGFLYWPWAMLHALNNYAVQPHHHARAQRRPRM